ncbi:PP2C family serine/threonine-protein phosphatase [Rubellimicrobium arenae]|uniref:PP2C family serine/threonine-protein phosphatase n=1 Tax=Rubellimicrobium arenae TaxID=2817372 RepID=UPI0034A44191
MTRVPLGGAPAPRPEGAGLTHRGRVRSRNEDSILTDPTGLLWAVSDGMGGHGHGDVASDIVIDCLADISDAELELGLGEVLLAALRRANRMVRERGRVLGSTSMGATVVAAAISHLVAHVAWVGDSRAYLFRRGGLRLLTHDHTVIQDLLDHGDLTPDQASLHPESHVVTRAIGGADDVDLDLTRVRLLPGDWLVLCSDGLTGCLYDQRIGQALAAAPSPQDACRQLLIEALEAGAPDNVSVIAIHIPEG